MGGEGDQDICNFDTFAQCLTEIFKCGEEWLDKVFDAGDSDESVSDIPGLSDACSDAASKCAEIPQSYPHFRCQSGRTFCHTDFCATCCSPETTKCEMNDFGAACGATPTVCKCAVPEGGAGNPDSCCSNGGPGNGWNTGSFCGNDFHVGACNDPNYPYCCNSDGGLPACCAQANQCNQLFSSDPPECMELVGHPEPCSGNPAR